MPKEGDGEKGRSDSDFENEMSTLVEPNERHFDDDDDDGG